MKERKINIRKAAVLGAGVMGSKIAALLAGVDIPTYLLDIVPKELDQKDIKKGLTRESPEFRNKLAKAGIDGTVGASPPALFSPADLKLVTVGNFEDNLGWLADADWVIEVVAEDLKIKTDLLKKVEAVIRPGTIISTNTSGLSIEKISEALSKETRTHFLGTHFFNPPRHMKLLEIIPGKTTDPKVVSFMADFCERRLGKSIVLAKDTPNFIANRIGVYSLFTAVRTMVEGGYTIEEVDAITGPPMGRPKSASFRTADMVGLDTLAKVAHNVYDSLRDASEKEFFSVPPFLNKMVEMGLLGDKAQKGFYKKVSDLSGTKIYALDYNTVDYVPQRKPDLPILEQLKAVADPAASLQKLAYSDDRAGQFAWKVLKKMLLYCAAKIPEIADNILAIDQAMRWGFNWELGPFETWDAIGVRKSVERMRQEGEKIPQNVEEMLAKGHERFYKQRDGKRAYYDFARAAYVDIEEKPEIILLPSLKERKKIVRSNPGACLVDMGDGVVCLEFRTPNNAIDDDVVRMINESLDEVEENFEGMVIGNQGVNFSPGADVKKIYGLMVNKDWTTLDRVAGELQQALMRVKYSRKPVVAAPFRMTLGGGCETCLSASAVRAYAETYMGLVEMGVGIIPAGGGTKEMLLRATEYFPPSTPSAIPGGGRPDLIPYVARAFETIATGKVSTSAQDARSIGFLRTSDWTTMNFDHLLYDAKQTVLCLVKQGYRPPRPRDDIRVIGRSGRAFLELMVYLMRDAGYITDTDAHIARRLAYVISGGDVDMNTLVTEQYILDLEREVLCSLAGEEKTQARMRSMAETGKMLHN
ncbi:MAG: 3-hydroxyacyl-CoA dehydrogenase NAD-binding domain-containing protein [Dehalococcoidia bacterium]|nr:3-hydroxyacyl-CoA dehydrogenase NAD-binding domain-containing protein [Dehalococcoidia bacterium]